MEKVIRVNWNRGGQPNISDMMSSEQQDGGNLVCYCFCYQFLKKKILEVFYVIKVDLTLCLNFLL